MNILSKKNTLVTLVFVAVVLVSGCINPTEIAKSNEVVKKFLAEYPNSNVVASIVSNADIREECDNTGLPIKDYWKVSIQDPDTKLEIKAWVDADKKQFVCVVKTGGKEKENPQENKTNVTLPDKIKENKTDDIQKSEELNKTKKDNKQEESEKDINKTKSNATNIVSPSPEIGLCDNSCIGISYFHFNADGDDRYNLNDEYVIFKSTCIQACDLTGWTVKDIANHLYTLSSFIFEKDSTVTLHTGSGQNTKTDLYWQNGGAVWNNDGDTLYLRNSKGELVLSYPYTGQ